MELSLSWWVFTLIPIPVLLFALFWGIPAMAQVSEILGLIMGRPFPARTARQTSRLGLISQAITWLLLTALALWLFSLWPFERQDFFQEYKIQLLLNSTMPFFGSLAFLAYFLTWKTARKQPLLHILLGCLANIPLKYAYWGLIFLGTLYVTPGFFANTLPPIQSLFWPLAWFWPTLSILITPPMALIYVLIRRGKDDWGRDYYRFAPPFLVKWYLCAFIVFASVLIWGALQCATFIDYTQLAVLIPAGTALSCFFLSLVPALCILFSQHPMRCKVSMLLLAGIIWCFLSALSVFFVEALNQLPGYSFSTFIPDLLANIPWLH